MTIDLRTRYLGLDLRSPLVASAAPHNAIRRWPLAWPGPVSGPSSCRRCSRRRSRPRSSVWTPPWSRGPRRSPRPSTTSRPSDRWSARPTAIWRPWNGSRPPWTCRSSRQLNATTTGGWVHHARRLQDAGADALELNLYHVAGGPAADRRPIAEATDLALIAAVRAAISIPLAVKLSPYYSALASFAGAAIARRRRRPGPVQPLLPARPRPRGAGGRAPAGAEPALGAAAARCAGSPSCGRSSVRPCRWPRHRASTAARCPQGPDGRRGRGDDDIGPAAPRPGARGHGRGGAAGLDDRARVRAPSTNCVAAPAPRPPPTRRSSNGPTTWPPSGRGPPRRR